jgi:hypothetical protein
MTNVKINSTYFHIGDNKSITSTKQANYSQILMFVLLRMLDAKTKSLLASLTEEPAIGTYLTMMTAPQTIHSDAKFTRHLMF